MAKQLNLLINPTEKQFEAWEAVFDDETSELGFGGAGGGGKSYFAAGDFLTYMCCTFADTRWLLGRKELQNLKRTSLKTLFKVMGVQGLRPDVHYVYNKQDSIITFWNKSEILLMNLAFEPSDELYLRLGGLELTGAVIEESNEIQVMGLNILKTRLGRWNNEKYKLKAMLIETFNPDKGHVYHAYYKPHKENKLPSYRKFIKALPTDNPHNPKVYLDQLDRADKITKARLKYGDFEYDDNPLALMEADSIGDLFTNKPRLRLPKYITVDVARKGKDKSVIMLWHGLYVVRIISIAKNRVDELWDDYVKPLAEDEEVPRSHIIADEDGVGGGLVDIGKIKGFIGNSTPLKVRDSERPTEWKIPNYTNLRSQSYYSLSQYVNDGKIGIDCRDESIKELIIEELTVVEGVDIDKDQKLKVVSKDIVKEKIGRSPDYSDTLMMRMWFELGKRPEPRIRVLGQDDEEKSTQTEAGEPIIEDPFMDVEDQD